MLARIWSWVTCLTVPGRSWMAEMKRVKSYAADHGRRMVGPRQLLLWTVQLRVDRHDRVTVKSRSSRDGAREVLAVEGKMLVEDSLVRVWRLEIVGAYSEVSVSALYGTPGRVCRARP